MGIADDPAFNYFTLYMAMSYFALQAKVGLCEVNHINTPYFQRTLDSPFAPTYLPQFNYCETSWLDVTLPPLVSHVLDGIGVVVQNGYLRVPVVDYNKKGITYNGDINVQVQGMLGPVYWSSTGYVLAQDSYYEVPNLFSTAIAAPDSTPPAPGGLPELVVYNDGGFEILRVDKTYMDSIWGVSNINGANLYPNAFSGSQFTQLLDDYTYFNALNNNVNQSPLISFSDCVVGGLGVMSTNSIPDPDLATVSSIAPVSGSAVVASGNPRLAEIPSATLVSGQMLSPGEAFTAALFNGNSVMNSAIGTPGLREYRINLKIAMINKSAHPSYPAELGQPIAAPFSANIPSASSTPAIFNSVNSELFRPSSKFADGIRSFQDKHPKKFAFIKDAIRDPDLRKYLADALRPYASKMFARVQSKYPQVADMGKFIKHITDVNAGTLQTVISRSQITSNETSGDTGNPSGFQLVKKIVSQGYGMLKAIGVFEERGLSNMAKGVKEIAKSGVVQDVIKLL